MATLKQIQARLKKLQAQTERLIAARAQAVLDDIRAMMEKHGLTTDDIERHGKKFKRAPRPNVTFPAPAGRHEAVTRMARKGKLPAKYRNPETGETWSGWARPPAWIANVKDRSKFLIDAEATENTIKPKAAATKKMAARKSPVSAQPPVMVEKKAKAVQPRASTAKKHAVSFVGKKTTRPAAKRSASRKQAADAAPQEIAEVQETSNALAPTDNNTSTRSIASDEAIE